ncbi:hypothetical protein [Ensifer aridi]|uniref:hypothetical protein n=1 Tax=Ensifer aridi TaxID=1708715 RepID=UPI000A0F8108|nr:hypothetical protein [Ensifer aridi]
MPEQESYIFYTSSRVDEVREDRWAYTGIPDLFYLDAESARRSVLEVREDVIAANEEWSAIQIEKIETLPVSKETIFALLNDGIGAFVKNYEIIEVIE